MTQEEAKRRLSGTFRFESVGGKVVLDDNRLIDACRNYGVTRSAPLFLPSVNPRVFKAL